MDNAKNTEMEGYFDIQRSTGSEALKRSENMIKKEDKFREEVDVLKKQFFVE